jgi:peptide/nickel transport system substrate-binding protein
MVKRKMLLLFVLAASVLALPFCAQAAAQYGGVLKIGAQPVNNLDPHFATSIADIMLLEQVYHHLTYIDASNRPVPDLATKWNSPDGKTWTFTLRPDVKFNNGAPVTAKDVAYSFNRLRDPKVGSPVVKLYKNILKVEAPDATHVRFTLTHQNPEFASDVGDYHASIIPDGLKDPAKKRISSGPFMIASYFPEDRIILKKNPYFNQKDAAGNRLPYLDEVHMIFSPDIGGQVEALRGGELNFVGGLTTEFAETIKKGGSAKILTNDSNMHWAIHMRSDKGHIAADNRIRKALKLATNHKQIINAVRPGLAAVGNGFSPVGPAYGKYYLDKAPVMDLQKAKKLLAEAGHPNGLKINLVAQNQLDVIPIATVWKEQLAKIGITVDIKVVPSDVYFGDGAQSWLKCDFGITDWGARATPVTYFNLAYASKGPWNESHWSDAEFDRLTSQVDREMDFNKRVKLYHQLQQIMIERGPIVVAYFEKSVAGVSSKVQNVKLAADWARTRFWNAYFKK